MSTKLAELKYFVETRIYSTRADQPKMAILEAPSVRLSGG
jgi:hypothetical protein